MPLREDVVIKFGADDKRLQQTITNIGKSVNGMSKAFGAFEGAIASIAAGSGLRNLIELNARFEELQAAVEFAGGDFASLNELASDNAAAIEDVAQAYARLQNLNLDSSRRAIEAYLNVAAGTPGKTLIDFAEAVADAVVGEFERLKEFGIKATKEGNQIALNFRGNRTLIENDAKKIEEALISIGEVDFAGAQASRANTLSGALNNLSSAFNQLFVNESATKEFTASIRDLTDTLSDPSVVQGINSFGAGLLKAAQGLAVSIGGIGNIGSDIASFFSSVSGFEGLGIDELIVERNKLNAVQANAIVQAEELRSKIEDGAFWLNAELKLQESIVEESDEQLALISSRLKLLQQESQIESDILDTKKQQTEEIRKQTVQRARQAAGKKPSAGLGEGRGFKSEDIPTLGPGELFNPTPEQIGDALSLFREGEISATELGIRTGIQSHDTVEPQEGAFGTPGNLTRPLPSTEGISQTNEAMRPSPIGGEIQPADVGLDHTYIQEQVAQAIEGRIYRVRVDPQLIGVDSIQDETDKSGARP